MPAHKIPAPAIGVRDLRIDVPDGDSGSVTLIDSLSFAIRGGEHWAILGPSGSGKTSLLSVLGLLRSPSSGTISFGRRDVTKLADAEAARIRNAHLGFVFQDYNLIPHLSVLENVMLPLFYGTRIAGRAARTAALDELAAVGMTAYANRHPMTLSGGEQQRVAIARALVRAPAVLLADEPTGALDLRTADIVFEHLLAATRDRGLAAVVVTHDRAIAARLDHHLDLGADNRP